MSKASYERNHFIYWNILCSYTIKGKENKYLYIAVNNTLEGSLEDAKRDHVWGKHPTFKAKVVGIRFE